MRPASFEQWMVVVAVVGAVGLGACGGSGVNRGVTLPIVSVPAKVIVTPASVTVAPGASTEFSALVEDSAGASAVDQAVHWSLTPPSAAIAISDSGTITPSCNAAGTWTVVATSAVDSAVSGMAQVVVPAMSAVGVSIASIVEAVTGQPANLDSVTDSLQITTGAIHAIAPCQVAREADLVVSRPEGDTVVDRVPLDTTAAADQFATLTFHSDAKVGGVAQFPNGQYAMAVDLILAASATPAQSSTIQFTVKNP